MKAEILKEAYDRGLLPPKMAAEFEEALKRGLIPGMTFEQAYGDKWLRQTKAEEAGGIERDPWIDPVTAMTGGAVAGSKMGAKIAGKVGRGLLGAGTAALAEPGVGAIQGQVDEWAGELPGYARLPINVATGFAVGGLSNKMLERPLEKGLMNAGDRAKEKVYRDVFEKQFKGLDVLEAPKQIELTPRKLSEIGAEEQGFRLTGEPTDKPTAKFAPWGVKKAQDEAYTPPAEFTNVPKIIKEAVKDIEPKTLRQRIMATGGIKSSGLEGKFKDLAPGEQQLARKTGAKIDTLETDLKSEGWLMESENLTEVLKDSSRLGMPHTRDIGTSARTKQEQQFKREMEHEPEYEPETKTRWEDAAPDDFDPNRFYSNPIPQAWKIFTDTYGKYIGTPLWDALVAKQLPKLLQKVPGAKTAFKGYQKAAHYPRKAMEYGFRAMPENERYQSITDSMKQKKAAGQNYAVDLGKRLNSLPEHDQLKIGEYLRGELNELPENIRGAGEESRAALDLLGKQATELGLLSEKTYFENLGKYMPRLYTSKEYQTLLTRYGITKPNRLDLSRFKKRKDIPKEIREQMGEILTPGYPVAKGLAQLSSDIEMAKWFRGIGVNPEWAAPRTKKIFKDKNTDEVLTKWIDPETVPEGFIQLPKTEKLGDLNGAYVHPEIYKELNEIAEIKKAGTKALEGLAGWWKFHKVIASPKTHSRNILSNTMLAHVGGLPLPMQPYYLIRAAKEMKTGGEYWKIANAHGLLDNTFVKKELQELYGTIEQQLGRKMPDSLVGKVGHIAKSLIDLRGTKVGNKLADAYQAEEGIFKVAKMIHNIDRRGMTPKEAAADAEEWLFNYGKLTRFQDLYRRKLWGAPFSTFSFKVMPAIAKTMVKTPWRLALPAYIISQIEAQSIEKIGDTKEQLKAKKKLRPDWMQGEMAGMPNFPRVSVVDKHGREYWLNLTYMTPWGDIAEAGGVGGIPGGLMPFSHPLSNEIIQQAFNYDKFRQSPIVREEETAGMSKMDKLKVQLKKRGRHLYDTAKPTWFGDVEKMAGAARSGDPRSLDRRGRGKPPGVVAADVLGGIKMYPVDYGEQMRRKAVMLDPKKGVLARKLKSRMTTLAVKRKAVKKLGGKTTYYDNEIKKITEQLKGMGQELKEYAQAYKKAMGKPVFIPEPKKKVIKGDENITSAVQAIKDGRNRKQVITKLLENGYKIEDLKRAGIVK